MTGQRYVLLGLGHPRSAWFRDVARWATAATIPAEFTKCVSADEVRARLASGRPHSALIVDAALPAFDRDLVAEAATAGTPTVAIGDGRPHSWSPADVGVVAVLAPDFSPADLLAVLDAHARMLGRGDELPPALAEPEAPLWQGRLLAVTGPGGTGASTAAIALAQALAADGRYRGSVVLADLALRGDQAMLHDARDLGPGIQELVESHRLGRPSPESVVAATFAVPARGYRLLLGLRRPSAWAALRPRAFDAALNGLRAAFGVVVADVSGDLEGESDSGSAEVEERNHMARATVTAADVVVAVGGTGLKGTHSLAQLLRDILAVGVSPERVVPAISRAPRSPHRRAQLSAAVAELTGQRFAVSGPVPIPERNVEEALSDGIALPQAVGEALAGAVHAALERLADAAPPQVAPQPVEPGTLAGWYDTGGAGGD